MAALKIKKKMPPSRQIPCRVMSKSVDNEEHSYVPQTDLIPKFDGVSGCKITQKNKCMAEYRYIYPMLDSDGKTRLVTEHDFHHRMLHKYRDFEGYSYVYPVLTLSIHEGKRCDLIPAPECKKTFVPEEVDRMIPQGVELILTDYDNRSLLFIASRRGEIYPASTRTIPFQKREIIVQEIEKPHIKSVDEVNKDGEPKPTQKQLKDIDRWKKKMEELNRYGNNLSGNRIVHFGCEIDRSEWRDDDDAGSWLDELYPEVEEDGTEDDQSLNQDSMENSSREERSESLSDCNTIEENDLDLEECQTNGILSGEGKHLNDDNFIKEENISDSSPEDERSSDLSLITEINSDLPEYPKNYQDPSGWPSVKNQENVSSPESADELNIDFVLRNEVSSKDEFSTEFVNCLGETNFSVDTSTENTHAEMNPQELTNDSNSDSSLVDQTEFINNHSDMTDSMCALPEEVNSDGTLPNISSLEISEKLKCFNDTLTFAPKEKDQNGVNVHQNLDISSYNISRKDPILSDDKNETEAIPVPLSEEEPASYGQSNSSYIKPDDQAERCLKDENESNVGTTTSEKLTVVVGDNNKSETRQYNKLKEITDLGNDNEVCFEKVQNINETENNNTYEKFPQIVNSETEIIAFNNGSTNGETDIGNPTASVNNALLVKDISEVPSQYTTERIGHNIYTTTGEPAQIPKIVVSNIQNNNEYKIANETDDRIYENESNEKIEAKSCENKPVSCNMSPNMVNADYNSSSPTVISERVKERQDSESTETSSTRSCLFFDAEELLFPKPDDKYSNESCSEGYQTPSDDEPQPGRTLSDLPECINDIVTSLVSDSYKNGLDYYDGLAMDTCFMENLKIRTEKDCAHPITGNCDKIQIPSI